MHYEEFRKQDLRVLSALLKNFPLATIAISSDSEPLIAQAPVVYYERESDAGYVEFHLARANPVVRAIDRYRSISIVVCGPSAPVSPSWYRDRFKGDNPDRSRTAPTYNYVSVVLKGVLETLSDQELQLQMEHLVQQSEPDDGWRFSEIDPSVLANWSRFIVGYRLTISSFELRVKASQEQSNEDRRHIVTALRRRDNYGDVAMAAIVEALGTAEELAVGLRVAKGAKVW